MIVSGMWLVCCDIYLRFLLGFLLRSRCGYRTKPQHFHNLPSCGQSYFSVDRNRNRTATETATATATASQNRNRSPDSAPHLGMSYGTFERRQGPPCIASQLRMHNLLDLKLLSPIGCTKPFFCVKAGATNKVVNMIYR